MAQKRKAERAESTPAFTDEEAEAILMGTPIHDPYRQQFIDQAAIALYANGWPQKTVWMRAAQLWDLREKELGK